MASSLLSLPADEVHLWRLQPQALHNQDLLEQYQRLVSPEEYEQQMRYVFPKHQRQHLLTRALIRTTLSRYVEVPPSQWRFVYNSYGKPSVEASQATFPLQFNVSHSDEWIVLLVNRGSRSGVDVENAQRVREPMILAERFFSREELQDLLGQKERAQRRRFFDYWTLGEAYIKATGMGLALPLDQFTFHIRQAHPITISFGSQITDTPSQWKFWQTLLPGSYQLAIALECPHYQAIRVLQRDVIPLQSETPWKEIHSEHPLPPLRD